MKQILAGNTQAVLMALVIAAVSLTATCAKIPRANVSPGQTTSQANSLAPNQNSSQININTASIADLERLPGIGNGLAARIVAHRNSFGYFRRVEHLLMVRGISDRKFRELRPLITVE